MNTENKIWWVRKGKKLELLFVKRVGPLLLPLVVEMNPEKEWDDYALDLLVDRREGDLKTRATPFYTVEEKYGIPSRYAVTLNRNKILGYHPSTPLLIWLEWQRLLVGTEYEVEPLSGVWITTPAEILRHRPKVHWYADRVRDNRGNADCSYVVSVKWFKKLAGDEVKGLMPKIRRDKRD